MAVNVGGEQVFQAESTFLIHHANAFVDGDEIEVSNTLTQLSSAKTLAERWGSFR